MMKHSPVDFTFSAASCIWGCLLLLLAPLNLVFSFYVAATVHELSHILALRLFHVPIYSISLGISGAVIHTAPICPKQELICAAAGPAGSFLCILLLRTFPLAALFGLIQGIYNLLPVYPMDGGRMLRCICQICCPSRSDLICKAVMVITLTTVGGLCLYLYIHTSNSLFLLITLYILLQTCPKRKIPCKEPRY